MHLDHNGQVSPAPLGSLSLCSNPVFVSQTALHLVASKNRLDVGRALLSQDPPASSRLRDKRGQYPIHRAAAVGSTPMITLLLEHKSPLDATDSTGYTALHHAIAEGHGAESIDRARDLAPD